MSKLNHPIVTQSFQIIDREVGDHQLSPAEYAIAQRVIHATADFEYLELLRFSSEAIASGINSLIQGVPIVTDVNMVKQGVLTMVRKTFNNPVIAAIDQAPSSVTGQTRSAMGMRHCLAQYPEAIYVIGNAPTALITLCEQQVNSPVKPALVIGAPVGFVKVIESKQALAKLDLSQISIAGRKGGSSAASAILNALLVLAAARN